MALVSPLHLPPKSIINPNYSVSPDFSIDQKLRRSVTVNFHSHPKLVRRISIEVHIPTYILFNLKRSPRRCLPVNDESNQRTSHGDGDEDLGVKVALSILRFYKNEISPLMPRSCRYVPTCSEYSMIAYKKYGVVKGSILTAWRICRCNPIGGSGFDPPRWFDEPSPPEQ